MVHTISVERWIHDHAFGQDREKSGERRTLAVITITAAMTAVEVAAGLAFGSIALLADGLHMASHSCVLTVAAFAYYYARRHARDPRFNFGTGKISSLSAFAGAVLLAVFALVMAWESVGRLLSPARIAFDQAVIVACLGLVVNGVCLFVLKGSDREHPHADHNLWSAYLHVLADALTSLSAIVALLAGKHLGLAWMDPVMGVVGAALVTRWSWGLIGASSRVLLDIQAPESIRRDIRAKVEADGDDRVTDLHVWAVGPGIFAAEIAVVASAPQTPEHYRRLLPRGMGIVHATFEVRRCPT